jgi:ABC-type ATPase with predicted acetyltransferase domain
MAQYTIDVKFQTSVTRSPRVIEVAEAFGIGLADGEFRLYDNLKLDIDQGDVVYITGQSGSGKSIALVELSKLMRDAGKSVASLDDIELEDKPIIEQLGKTMADATNLLARAGISDAFLYVRKPSELSDGQRYRLRLAKLIERKPDVWVADEFGAVLDRVTAKVVAFNMAKVARSLGVTLIVATTHTDLGEELGPDLTIVKHFRERVSVSTIKEPIE